MVLEYTGERLVPEKAEGYVFWEHVYRYRFALQFARGRSVLDIACGEGYGTASLGRVAESVIGVDISESAVDHAKKKYGIDVRVGSAEAIPVPSQTIEVVVSFETIEHVQNPAAFIRECHRVLVPGGLLVLSTPNRDIYSEQGHHNEFHIAEMNESEFRQVLEPQFSRIAWFRQRPTVGSWRRPLRIWADNSPWVSNLLGRGMRRVLRGMFCPHTLKPPKEELRNSPIEAVHATDRPFSQWVNPYSVQPRLFGETDRPSYYIVVARRID
jgi:SAM-dependent methyltransferase